MTTKNNRIKSTGLANRIDFEVTVDRCSFIQVELDRLNAQKNQFIQIAQAHAAEHIAELQAEQKFKVALCEKYAEEHRAELLPDEKKTKSNETPLSRYGFRTGTPSLKLLSKISWEKVVDNLRALKLTKYIRTTYEPDKQKLLADGTNFTLSEIGVKIVQSETFFIEPKVDGGETIKVEGAA